MKITILQTDIHWGCVAENIAAVERLMMRSGQSDIYVLPEMWATGFAAKQPEKACSEVPFEWMLRTAESRKCAICGSLVAEDGDGSFRNRMYFVKPDGTFTYCDKRHLFTYGGEDKHYVRGGERGVVEYCGVRFLLQTCYDLRFPVWMRNNGDYDAILLVANWPESRQGVWHILLRARAIENQCYVVAANRVGADPVSSYMGHSAVIDAKGRTIAQASDRVECALTADIDIEPLMTFRKKFPVLEDRDEFRVMN